jgi:predicted AAA+ superfamily ATPase
LGGEPSRFYFKSEIILPPVYIYKVNDPLIVLKGLRKIGATHVLIFDKLYSRREGDNILYHPDDAALDLHWDLEHLRASRTFQEIYRNDKAVLYQVFYLLPSGNGAGSEYSRLLNF